MKIASIAFRFPKRCLSNRELISLLEMENSRTPARLKRKYLSLVQRLLDQAGARTRHWRDPAAGETPSELIVSAMRTAIETVQLDADAIDLLIYCGVGKGFLEPANAYFYASEAGLRNADCFDVTDACMSWVRAAEIVQAMLASGRYRAAMVINGEFHLGYRADLKIRDLPSLRYTFPAYTIGEAATATVFLSGGDDWRFSYATDANLADLCTVPLPGYEDYVTSSDRIGLNGINHFVSFGKDINPRGIELVGRLLTETIENRNSVSLYIPHAHSLTAYREIAARYALPLDQIYLEVYPRFGNLVSASVPAALFLSQQDGTLQRGDQVALIPASAGMSAAVVQFRY